MLLNADEMIVVCARAAFPFKAEQGPFDPFWNPDDILG